MKVGKDVPNEILKNYQKNFIKVKKQKMFLITNVNFVGSKKIMKF